MIDAARGRFLADGYVATTIAGIATAASVSPETIYAIFGTKRNLLTAVVEASIAGGPEAGAIGEQAWVAELRTDPDLRRRIGILAVNGARILGRRAGLDAVVDAAAAADSEVANLAARLRAERHAGQRVLLALVLADDAPDSLDFDAAADTLFAIGSPEVYRLLVHDRGWSEERFAAWYRAALERLLL